MAFSFYNKRNHKHIIDTLGPISTISESVERKRKSQLAKLFMETGVTLEARRLSPDVTVTS